MAEHRHIFKYFYPSYDCELIVCDCGERLGRDEVLKRLNELEEIKVKGAYPIPSVRGFVISDKSSADPS